MLGESDFASLHLAISNIFDVDRPFLHIVINRESRSHAAGFTQTEVAQDFNRQKTQLSIKDIQESTKIWAGCYIAAQRQVQTASCCPDF